MNENNRKKAILIHELEDIEWWVKWQYFHVYEYIESFIYSKDEHGNEHKDPCVKIYKKDYPDKVPREVKIRLEDDSDDIVCGLNPKMFEQMFIKID